MSKVNIPNIHLKKCEKGQQKEKDSKKKKKRCQKRWLKRSNTAREAVPAQVLKASRKKVPLAAPPRRPPASSPPPSPAAPTSASHRHSPPPTSYHGTPRGPHLKRLEHLEPLDFGSFLVTLILPAFLMTPTCRR